MAKMKIATEDRPKVKAQCLRLLVTLRLNPAKMQLIWGFVESYLNLSRQEEQIFDEEIAEIEPEEKREEAMQYINSYQERGWQEQALIMTQRHLERKFGTLEAKIQSRLSKMTTQQLESLDDAAYDFQNIEELMAWLKRVRTPRNVS